jgi:hypothetical protein
MIHAEPHKPEAPRCPPIISGLGPSYEPSEPSEERRFSRCWLYEPNLRLMINDSWSTDPLFSYHSLYGMSFN